MKLRGTLEDKIVSIQRKKYLWHGTGALFFKAMNTREDFESGAVNTHNGGENFDNEVED